MKTSLLRALLLGTAFSAISAAAAAQTAPSSGQTPPPPAQTPTGSAPPAQAQPSGETATVEGVTVTARANDIRTSIDSISYSVAEDLQTASGSVADALRGIPSVEVDPDGNVTLRGDANVTILVDGRPSSLFSGQSRGQAVLQIPADQYARIEIMTNPSAAYRPDGSGGVINLISKPAVARPGATVTGSVRANLGTDGRYNGGGNVTWSRDGLTLSADSGLRHDRVFQDIDRLRERFDSGSGRWLEARNFQDVEGENDSAFVRLSAEKAVDAKTQVSGEVRYTEIETDAVALDIYEEDDAAGGVGAAFRQVARGGFEGQFTGGTARMIRRLDDQGHEWTNEARFDRNLSLYAHQAYADQYVPVASPDYEVVSNRHDTDLFGFTSAYVRPLADGAKLRLGYELDHQSVEMENRVDRGLSLATLAPDLLVSNEFHADQSVHAVYGTWERPFGKLTAQFGLRLEQALIDFDQITSGLSGSNDYFRAYPTLHLQYDLGDNQILRASYSQRIQRPGPYQLNPFLTYGDPLTSQSGNPDLEPQETDSFEVTWQRRVDQTFLQATLYYRDTTKAFTQVATEIAGGALVYRPENLGARTATGLELVANGRLHPTLRYNASINVFRQQIDAGAIVGAVDRSGTTVTGRATLNWQPTSDDFIQLSGVWVGEQLQAQGVRDAGRLINLGYRRKLNDQVSLQLTVRDVFDDYGDATTIETPTLRDRTERLFGGRIAFIGLTWNFGQGQRRAPEQFDFGGGQQGG